MGLGFRWRLVFVLVLGLLLWQTSKIWLAFLQDGTATPGTKGARHFSLSLFLSSFSRLALHLSAVSRRRSPGLSRAPFATPDESISFPTSGDNPARVWETVRIYLIPTAVSSPEGPLIGGFLKAVILRKIEESIVTRDNPYRLEQWFRRCILFFFSSFSSFDTTAR